MRKLWKSKTVLLTFLLCGLFLTACEDEDYDYDGSVESGASSNVDPSVFEEDNDGGSWAIYWYLCGSDLESEGSCATDDLTEALSVDLPENVTVVVETGGASSWQNDVVSAGRIQRWLLRDGELELVDERPSANMGEAGTLADFLEFAYDNYPADKVAVTFWNHGGGSLTGAAFDEVYNYDSLKLGEMYDAFTAVWDPNADDQPLELIGFDTCLMATIDTAYKFEDIAHFLVASEETEPGHGWDYSKWLGELAADPGMGGAKLGKIICDTYYEHCEDNWDEDSATLSLVDLSKVEELVNAYDRFGAEALERAAEDGSFMAEFARTAAGCENYGGNTKDEGYTNMVDLGHLARSTQNVLPAAGEVLAKLQEAVLYQVKGIYRSEATGLSCYYSYDSDVNNLNEFIDVGAGKSFKSFFKYVLTGELDEIEQEYLESMDISMEDLPVLHTLEDMGWDDKQLELDEDLRVFLDLGPEADAVLSTIQICLVYYDEEEDYMLYLGTDNDLDADWENGRFYDNFEATWGMLNDIPVYMELSLEHDDYNLYSVPVLINGEEYCLQVVYDYKTENWIIKGATKGIDDNGMASKELRKLQKGDEITILWQASTIEGDDEPEMYEADTIIVDDDLVFEEGDLPEGEYGMEFVMQDLAGGEAYSSLVIFEYRDGVIVPYVD